MHACQPVEAPCTNAHSFGRSRDRESGHSRTKLYYTPMSSSCPIGTGYIGGIYLFLKNLLEGADGGGGRLINVQSYPKAIVNA
jgi:hypothetical protein